MRAAQQDFGLCAGHTHCTQHGAFDEGCAGRGDDAFDPDLERGIRGIEVNVALSGVQMRNASACRFLCHARRHRGNNILGATDRFSQ